LRKIFTFLLLYIALGISIHAQFALQHSNAKQGGMGNTKLFSEDAFASVYNPSAYNTNDQFNFGLSVSPSPLVSGLNLLQASSQFQFKNNFIGLGLISSGSKLYKEQIIGLNYARNFTTWIIGGRLNFLSINQSDATYGNTSKITASIGTNVRVKKNLMVAAYINHLNQATIDKDKREKVATSFGAGFQYQFSQNVKTVVEGEKNFINPFNLKAGVEYNFQKLFFIRAGFQTYPIRPTIGLGFKTSGFQADYSYQNQSVLGGIHAIGISYQLTKK
jgi:opacity protein-like surface antigen